jgi:hypothetical protein
VYSFVICSVTAFWWREDLWLDACRLPALPRLRAVRKDFALLWVRIYSSFDGATGPAFLLARARAYYHCHHCRHCNVTAVVTVTRNNPHSRGFFQICNRLKWKEFSLKQIWSADSDSGDSGDSDSGDDSDNDDSAEVVAEWWVITLVTVGTY